MADAKYTRGDIYDLSETMFELVSQLSTNEGYWDSIGGNRRGASDDIVDLAIALETVARENRVEWGETHDYPSATDALATMYSAYSEKNGCVKRGDDLLLARSAVNEARICRESENGELIEPDLI